MASSAALGDASSWAGSTITDGAVVEFLANGEPVAAGEPGDIVVTGLHNFAQPLIRYDLGDVGVPSDRSCPCGRTWPIIDAIEGRKLDFLTMPSGRRFPPTVVFGALHVEAAKHILCVSEYQVVQDEPSRLVLNVVPGREFDPEIVEGMRRGLSNGLSELGEAVHVESRVVEALENGRTGKIRMVVSRVG